MLVSLSSQEKPSNLHNPSYEREDGTMDTLPLGVPRGWATEKLVPRGGVFRVTYKCAPEDRNFKCRMQLCENVGGWASDALENTVLWWGAPSEAPTDVQELLEFLISRYVDIYDAFLAIDGPGGNGVITLKEFEVGLRKMKCRKFKGPSEQQKIASIFRYLDPGGEGSISREEWGILEQLYRELNLSISEFVQFCIRTFGED